MYAKITFGTPNVDAQCRCPMNTLGTTYIVSGWGMPGKEINVANTTKTEAYPELRSDDFGYIDEMIVRSEPLGTI